MARSTYVPTLYRPINLHPEPISSSSIVRLGASNSSQTELLGSSRKRTFGEISGHDEQSYSRRHLACEASIYFRSRSGSPRSFLWRVLNDGRLLEIQCVDLITDEKSEESSMTYHIAFTSAIVAKGVALADAEKSDALQAFVLTANNEITTITLKRDLLERTSVPSDASVSIHVHPTSALSFRRPFKLVALSSLELIVTLRDGGLLKLERTSEDAQWKETHFSEGGWAGSLRGLIPLGRQQTVRYGDLDLSPDAAVSVVKTPDNSFIWTTTVAHALVAWDQRTGKIVARRDLLGGPYELDNKKPRYTIPVEQGELLQLIKPSKATFVRVNSLFDEESQYHLIVFSPKQRSFKIYGGAISTSLARADSLIEDEPPRLFDFLDGHDLQLPFDDLLDTNLWRVTGFHVRPGRQWNDSQIWVRIQVGSSSRVLGLTFDLFNDNRLAPDLEQRWRQAWTLVTDKESLKQAPSPESTLRNPTDAWLQYLFYPNRFDEDTLETALYLFQERKKIARKGSELLQAKQALQARVLRAVSLDISLTRTPSDKPDLQQYYNQLQIQWSGFFAIVQDLQRRRSHPLGIAVDDALDLVWMVSADSVSPVCKYDKLDMLMQNSELDHDDERYEQITDDIKAQIVSEVEDWDVMKILHATQDFAASLPQSLCESFASMAMQTALEADLDANVFFGTADIGRQISDESCQSLEMALQPLNGIGGLTDSVFIAALGLIEKTGHRGSETGALLTRYGSRATVELAQELIQRDKTILLSLLALITFINNDFEHENLDQEFHVAKIFDLIMTDLRHLALREWLAGTSIVEPASEPPVRTTILSSLFIGDWDSHAPKDLEFMARLTHWCRQWTFANFNDWQDFTSYIFAMLLKSNLYNDARDFERFLVLSSSWTSYLRARLYIAIGRQDEAALLFSSAAEALSAKQKADLDTADLLSAEEHNYIGAGQEQYFLHVAWLFEKQHLYGYTADFASQALSCIDERHVDRELHAIDKRKSATDSPLDKVADARAEVRLLRINTVWEQITSRLFNAQLLTGQFERAFETLAKMRRPGLKRANLNKLIESMLSNGCADSILRLPLDNDLAHEADQVLAQVAKKTLLSGTVQQAPQQILYAYRINRGDYRGAAEVLYERLERLRYSQRQNLRNPEDESMPHAYLVLINTLACCGDGEDWLLADPIPGVSPADARRKLVTLDQVRQEYVADLDRRSDLQHGRFPLVGHGVDDADEMDTL